MPTTALYPRNIFSVFGRNTTDVPSIQLAIFANKPRMTSQVLSFTSPDDGRPFRAWKSDTALRYPASVSVPLMQIPVYPAITSARWTLITLRTVKSSAVTLVVGADRRVDGRGDVAGTVGRGVTTPVQPWVCVLQPRVVVHVVEQVRLQVLLQVFEA